VKLRSGTYDVLSSGAVIGFKSEPIEFVFPEDQGETIICRLVFEPDDKENREPRVEPRRRGKLGLDLHFYNFNNHPFGIGNSDPLELGEYRKRRLYVYYRVYTLQAAPEKLVHYTWYLGEEVPAND